MLIPELRRIWWCPLRPILLLIAAHKILERVLREEYGVPLDAHTIEFAGANPTVQRRDAHAQSGSGFRRF